MLYLPSNASMEYFPDNTLSNFTVKPSHPIENGDQLECALCEIIFPNRFLNIRNGSNNIIVYRMLHKRSHDYKRLEFTIPSGYYETIGSLLQALRDAVGDITVHRLEGEASKAFDFEETSGHVRIEVRHNYSIQFGSDIALLLGFPTNERMSHIISESVTGKHHATLSGGLNTMYVYTDIIKDQQVGGIAAPLLRIVNLDRKTNNEDQSSRIYQRLHYVPLRTNRFDTVNVQLRDDTGELMHFEYGKVVVSLVFREKAIKGS